MLDAKIRLRTRLPIPQCKSAPDGLCWRYGHFHLPPHVPAPLARQLFDGERATQAVLIAMFGAGACSDFIRNGTVEIERFQIAGSTCFIIGVLLLPVAMRLNHRGRVRIDYYGIEAIDDRGTRWIIDWNKMESVAIVRFWGWRSIRVRTSDGRTLWLPLYVSRPEEYGEVVEQYAGSDHPLSRALSFSRPES